MVWTGDHKTQMLATWNILCIDAPAIVTANIAVEMNVANGSKVLIKEVIPHPEDHEGWSTIHSDQIVRLSRPPISVFVELSSPEQQKNYNYHPHDHPTWSPPAWTPTETDLSDPDIVKAIDTHIAELQRVKNALLKLKHYGDFPVRTVLPSNPEARIDVLFRGATAEDVARWNKNEFKLGSGQVGADEVFCAGNFEAYVRWSEILEAEEKVEKEMQRGNGEVFQFWEELNQLEGRIR
jgi:hypothetical protein